MVDAVDVLLLGWMGISITFWVAPRLLWVLIKIWEAGQALKKRCCGQIIGGHARDVEVKFLE
jgi:hypothetical protein